MIDLQRIANYAEKQARVRARLGTMPDAERWHHIARAGDLQHLIDRMRDSGLDFWVAELPREPGGKVIEAHLQGRFIAFIRDLQRLIPQKWQRAGE